MSPRARVGRDDRGRLNVYASARVQESHPETGKPVQRRLQRRVVLREDDEALAQDVANELNRRFAVGDLSFFESGRSQTPQTPSGSAMTFGEWCERWLETYKPPHVSRRCWENYSRHVSVFCSRWENVALTEVQLPHILEARGELERTLRPRTVTSYLGTLKLVFRDAEIAGEIQKSPLTAGALPKRRTKRSREGLRRRVTFRPFLAEELERLLDIARAPRNSTEARYFPLVEFLVLTGLRFGEGAGLDWSRISQVGRIIHVDQATERGESELQPTKTAGAWTIELRPVLADLLERQEQRTGRHGLVFPGASGGPVSYFAWRTTGWIRILERARVAPREGDAQKACRRSYITSGLLCGRNAKQVASEVGHTTMRMVVEQYDSFIDPSRWPHPKEIQKLAELYGWPRTDREGRVLWLPRGYPPATQDGLETDEEVSDAH